MTIDPELPDPVYVQLADIIERWVASGEIGANRPLPAEPRLAEEFGVAAMTVRRAIRELRRRGLVRTVHGKGTYVLPEGERPQT